jgi:hypothetical protein
LYDPKECHTELKDLTIKPEDEETATYISENKSTIQQFWSRFKN